MTCWHQVLTFLVRLFIYLFINWSLVIKHPELICLLLNLISSTAGDIPDLFSDEDMDMIVNSIRMELRGLGLIDTRDNCWSFFIERIRRQLKV